METFPESSNKALNLAFSQNTTPDCTSLLRGAHTVGLTRLTREGNQQKSLSSSPGLAFWLPLWIGSLRSRPVAMSHKLLWNKKCRKITGCSDCGDGIFGSFRLLSDGPFGNDLQT